MGKDKMRKQGRKVLFEDVEEEEEEKGRIEGGDERKAVGEAEGYKERQLRRLLEALEAFRNGDTTVRLPKEEYDLYGELADSYNKMAEMVGGVATEVSRVAKVGGTEGKLTERASVPGVAGSWKDIVDNLNGLIDAIAKPTLEIGRMLDNISKGNLTEKFAILVTGDFKVMADTVNKTLDDLNLFGTEVTRVAREVGVDGKLGAQAEVPGVAGTWKELTENVNMLASNLTSQVRNIALVTTAVADGDLSQKITVEARGEIQQLKDTLNKMVDNLSMFGSEVTRVAREVGVEGKLGAQAEVLGVAGAWKELTENVNMMAANLTDQVRNIALVTTAVADGDLSQKITVEARGEIQQLKDTINTMVDRLNLFGGEVTRVAKEVGVEGKLGAQAEVPGVAGTWKELTENVNVLAANLTNQVRNIVEVNTAVANGDLTKKITVEAAGEILQLKDTVNKMVDNLSMFGTEVTRVAGEVGVEGKLGAQAEVPGVAGIWKELTENVNMLAANLTSQVRNIAEVNTAVAQGDLTKKITVEAAGEILQLKDTVNKMVDNLSMFGTEVTRVAGEVGVEGKLGAQAEVPGVAGTWKELTENVNVLASNLTSQVRNIALVTTAVADGDLSQKITVEARGEIQQLKDTINRMVDSLNLFGSEVTRVAREVGVDGKLGAQAEVPGVSGTWKELTENVNMLAANLTNQVRNIAEVNTAVAQGDLTKKITVEAQGEILQLKDTVNNMVDSLSMFGSEVTRVAREVGVEGKLGAQAEVPGVAGAWQELTTTVNMLAANLTNQVRNIALVTTAVANGDLSQKITVEAKGEIQELKNTINGMVDNFNAFGTEVTRVAREVGVEGKLGAQAEVPGVAGAWQELTNSVNMLAANLTNQVRNIALVTTAVANGDLSQKITVEAKGEIQELKDTINGMVDSLSMIIGDVNNVMSMVGEGKLTRLIGAEASGEFASMVKGINGTIESLQGIIKELTEVGSNVSAVSQNMLSAGQEMNSMVTQVSSSAEQIAEGANAQAQQIADASKRTEGVGEIASNTVTRTEEMDKMAEVATKATGEGSEAMGETIKNTDLMLEGSKESVSSIESLSKSSEQIQEIIDVIRDIATQTNILAVNAAIEAVRAGKHGRGFAVVAEEVKTLSADSKDQAKKISTLVKSVQKETEETVTTIKTMAENVEMGKVSIEQTSNAFEDISHSIEGTTRTAKEISTAAAEQKKSIDTISETMDKISGIAADTSTGSAQSARSAKSLLAKMQELTSTASNLADMSARLQKTVGRFTIAGSRES